MQVKKYLKDTAVITKKHLDEIRKLRSCEPILILDDDSEFLDTTAFSLTKKGERVIGTTNVFRFFMDIGANNLKAILIDYKMPEAGALKVIEALDKFGCKTKIGIISKHSKENLKIPYNVAFFQKTNVGFIEDILTFVNAS